MSVKDLVDFLSKQDQNQKVIVHFFDFDFNGSFLQIENVKAENNTDYGEFISITVDNNNVIKE